MINSSYIHWTLLALLLAAFLIAKSPFLDQSLDRDEGMYLYLGQATLNGDIPYSDNYEMKPPGLYYNYALIRWLVDDSARAVRWTSIILGVLNILFLFLIAQQWRWTWGAIWGAAAFAVFQMIPYYQTTALLLEPIILFYFLLGVYLWQLKKGVWFSGFIPGLLFGWAILTKQNIVFLIMGYLLPVIIMSRKNTAIRRQFIQLLGGGLLSSVIVIAILMIQGAWSDFVYWVFSYPSQVYTQSIGVSKGVSLMSSFFSIVFSLTPVWWILGLLGTFIPLFLPKGKRPGSYWLLIWAFIFGFLSITPGLRFYGHYWILWLPALSLGVGSFAEAIKIYLPSKSRHAVLLIALVILIMAHVISRPNLYGEPNIFKWERLVYGKNPNYEIKKICEELDALNIEDENLIVFGSEPQTYFYLGIAPPTPHIFLSFLSKRHDRRQLMQEEFTTAIKNKKPPYAIYVNYPYSWSITSADVLDVNEWSRGYLSNFYSPIGLYDLNERYQLNVRWSKNVNDLNPQNPTYIQIMRRNAADF